MLEVNPLKCLAQLVLLATLLLGPTVVPSQAEGFRAVASACFSALWEVGAFGFTSPMAKANARPAAEMKNHVQQLNLSQSKRRTKVLPQLLLCSKTYQRQPSHKGTRQGAGWCVWRGVENPRAEEEGPCCWQQPSKCPARGRLGIPPTQSSVSPPSTGVIGKVSGSRSGEKLTACFQLEWTELFFSFSFLAAVTTDLCVGRRKSNGSRICRSSWPVGCHVAMLSYKPPKSGEERKHSPRLGTY